MRSTFKYRIYLNKAQEQILEKEFNFCRFLYNSALQERRSHYKQFVKDNPDHKEDGIKYEGITKKIQISYLTEIKKDFKEQVKPIYSQVLQDVINRLDGAFKSFFERCKKGQKPGYPRFKGADRFKSITFTQSDFKSFGTKLLEDKKHVEIYGLGKVKIKYHRPFEGICKTVTLTKKANKYYLCLSCDDLPIIPLAPTGKEIGIDLGLNSYITDNDGKTYKHPKPYKTSKEKLAFQQRKFDLKKKGSNNRKKQKTLIAKTYEKITNVRRDFAHKMSLKLIRENDKIVMEDLNVKSMLESENTEVKKSNIQDAAWGEFTEIITYKAERAGRLLVKVNPANTSKMCSCCGSIKESLELSDRTYHCEACGFALDRDQNAARNILGLGMSPAAEKSAPEASPFMER